MINTFNAEEATEAFNAILKVRDHVPVGTVIPFKTFEEILNYLCKVEAYGLEPQEAWALEELARCSDMPAEEWISYFVHRCEKLAERLEDVPSG